MNKIDKAVLVTLTFTLAALTGILLISIATAAWVVVTGGCP